MTEENDFWSWLDAHPTDSTARLVFADWLEERGDGRAAGMRAMGVMGVGAGITPYTEMGRADNDLYADSIESGDAVSKKVIPPDWFVLVEGYDANADERDHWWLNHGSRRATESAVALAFSRLPLERQSQLLEGFHATV